MSCSIDGCNKPHAAVGLCDTHYHRLRRYGSTDKPPRPQRGGCKVEDCARPHVGLGYCGRHWRSFKRHGDPLAAKDGFGARRKGDGTCAFDDCPLPYRSHGYCPKHYERFRVHGDPTVVVDPNAHNPWKTVGSYKILRKVGHPLARTSGLVLEHRLVLYDHIGAGPHPCHWCGTSVRWDVSWPKASDGLVVDHLDRDRSHNVPANLVPSCQPCNARRANQWRYAKVAATA